MPDDPALATSRLRNDVRRLLLCFVVVDIALSAYLILTVSGWGLPFEEFDRQLSLRVEGSVATWYSSMLLLLGGFLAGAIAQCSRHQEAALPRASLGWWIVAAGLLALSADEVAQLHEWAGTYFTHRVGRDAFGWEVNQDAPGGSAWVLLFAPVLFVGLCVLIRSIWSTMRQYPRSRLKGITGAICWALVPLLEMLEGQLQRDGQLHNWLSIAEEPLEIAGSTLLLYAFCGRLWLEQRRDDVPS